ncbi:ATP-binding response regulator [Aquabacterium sp.]|uniref:ATP-binding response regulator n=1 Tax=Aquabacterium sp. TaxID=1872578 RepID=UPI002BACFACA|nr:hybrid sensor histidine kinase/response regulator [Aquabacterium sp.]HSW07965.1 hybrid sensor histidine kinase/response regulator [Aquabacterium sp.]
MRWSTLIPEPADARTRDAMLRLFYAQSGASLAAAALLVVLLCAYARDRVPAWLLAAWALAFAVLLVLRARWRRVVPRLDDSTLAAGALAWQRRTIASAGLTGLLWSAAMLMVFRRAEPSSQMFAAMLACITGVASINVMAPQPRAFLMLMAPMSLTLPGLFIAMGSWAGLYYATLALAGAALATSLMLRHTQLLHESHAMRFEREALLAETQAARDAQARFLAAASHDLRQPVHALGLLAAQAEAELHGRRAAATASQLQSMAQALDGLIEALLDVSRLDSGAVVPRPRALPLATLFDRLAPEFAVLADARGLQWRLRPTPLWVHSDEMQLERMLRNLLSNALNYSVQGGVLLAARQRGGQVCLSVWDTGPGIAPEHQARIFDEFVQLQNPGRDRRRGHGLGLSIVARLSRLLQHPVALRSRLGRGSCFSVTLPLAVPLTLSTDPPPVAALAPLLPLQGRSVALVEDDEAVRNATVALLRAWGCVVWADAAVAPLLLRLQAEGLRPDRLISDWRLEEGDGLRAIAALRGWAGAGVPALLISGETLPVPPDQLAAQQITAARKPLPASALRAWLSAEAVPRSAQAVGEIAGKAA